MTLSGVLVCLVIVFIILCLVVIFAFQDDMFDDTTRTVFAVIFGALAVISLFAAIAAIGTDDD